MIKDPTIAVFFHNYYGRHEHWIDLICREVPVGFDLYYNVVSESVYNQLEVFDRREMKKLAASVRGCKLRDIILRFSPNLGKDLGGKLVLMDSFVRLKSAHNYILFLHGKESPYKADPAAWQEKLYRLIGHSFIDQAIATFSGNPNVGIIAAKGTVHRQPVNADLNTEIHTALREHFQITVTETSFVAGTMFLAKAFPYLEFFTKNSALQIRAGLEQGNVMDKDAGSITHSWERMWSWIVTSGRFQLKEL